MALPRCVFYLHHEVIMANTYATQPECGVRTQAPQANGEQLAYPKHEACLATQIPPTRGGSRLSIRGNGLEKLS